MKNRKNRFVKEHRQPNLKWDSDKIGGNGCNKVVEPLSNTELWFLEHKILSKVIAVFLFISICIICILSPDNGANTIKKELKREGYNVEKIEFTLIEQNNFWSDRGRIYQSSVPIEYMPGVFVDTWEQTIYRFGITSFFTYIKVKPYPEIPNIEPVNLRLTVTQEDYNLLIEEAGEQGIEEYIKGLIYNSIKENKNE